jgi:hypothetical protein
MEFSSQKWIYHPSTWPHDYMRETILCHYHDEQQCAYTLLTERSEAQKFEATELVVRHLHGEFHVHEVTEKRRVHWRAQVHRLQLHPLPRCLENPGGEIEH